MGGSAPSTHTSEIAATALQVQTSAYGLPIPIVFGMTRAPGNLLWYGDFTPIAHTTTTSSGGGGKGGGGGESTNTSYTYNASFAVGLCEGPITQVNGFWADKKKYAAASSYFTSFLGAYPQAAWSYLTSTHPGQDVPYQGIAYQAAAAYDLGNSSSLPNHSFEVVGLSPFNPSAGIYDANPKDIVAGLLSNPHWGAGFPSSRTGDLTSYSNYCVANGLFLSPNYDGKAAAAQMITDLMQITNTGIYFSEKLLKVVPYGDVAVTGNGATFTPNLTPAAYLSDDDFQGEGEDPVIVRRNAIPSTANTTADAYNQVQLEYLDRLNDYNPLPLTVQDQVAIDTYGLIPMGMITAHQIADATVANTAAMLILQRAVYVRNQYDFKLTWNYAHLEPTDIVCLTDSSLGMVNYPVRIILVEEDETGLLSITAEDAPVGAASFVKATPPAPGGYSVNYNASGGNSNAPVIFEAPDILTAGSGLEIWIGSSGQNPIWGGAVIWVSTDNQTYKLIGSLNNPIRQGILTAAFPSAADPDTTDTLSVDLSISRGTLTSGSQADADSFNTLCYVGGELVSYKTATLTALAKYNLTYLRRGAYNSTVAAHQAGDQFARIDPDAFFKYSFTPDRIGSTLYVKLLSQNVFGGGGQQLSDVNPVTYKITGSALQSSLPNVQNLLTRYVSGLTELNWDAVADFRQPSVDYEVRMGASWASGKVLGRTTNPRFVAVGDGTYWVAAHYTFNGSLNVYSQTPVSLVVAGAVLTKNVIASFDEAATSWGGTLVGGATIQASEVMLQGAGNILTDADFLNTPSILWYGGVASTGEYDLPVGHAVNIGRVAPCTVSMSYTARGQSISDNVLTLSDFLGVSDFFGAVLGNKINVQPQIAIAGAGGTYGAWQNFLPGAYNAQYFKARVLLSTSDPAVTAVLSDIVFTVDVPDRIDSYPVTVASVGQAVTFTSPFNGGPGASGNPAIQVTILNAVAGDDAVISGVSKTGCTVQIFNGGSGVVRAINLQAQGY